MRYPLDRTVDGNERLRGGDATFWPMGRSVFSVEEVYRFDDLVDYPADRKLALDTGRDLMNKAELRKIPLDKGPQTLYHWTDSFPSEEYVSDGVVTYGYIWTSTADEFLFRSPQRLTIVLPEGSDVEAFVDPWSHSRKIGCDGEPRKYMVEDLLRKKGDMTREELEAALIAAEVAVEHHNDVILQPSVFRVLRHELDWNLVGRVLMACKLNCPLPAKIEAVNRDSDGWILACTDSRRVRNAIQDEGMYKFGSRMIMNVMTILDDNKRIRIYAQDVVKSPVLEWVRDGIFAPADPDRVEKEPPLQDVPAVNSSELQGLDA